MTLLVIAVSCKDETEKIDNDVTTELEVGDITHIETLFDKTYFDTELEYTYKKAVCLDVFRTI